MWILMYLVYYSWSEWSVQYIVMFQDRSLTLIMGCFCFLEMVQGFPCEKSKMNTFGRMHEDMTLLQPVLNCWCQLPVPFWWTRVYAWILYLLFLWWMDESALYVHNLTFSKTSEHGSSILFWTWVQGVSYTIVSCTPTYVHWWIMHCWALYAVWWGKLSLLRCEHACRC